MKAFWGGLALSVLIGTFGCEREKRQVDPAEASPEISKNIAAEESTRLEPKGWLASISRDSALLVKLAEGSNLWGAFLQNRHFEVLESYDRLRNESSDDALVCARSAVELAKTALILERLLGELQSRLVEIEKGRKGSKDSAVEAVTEYVRLALQQTGDLSLPSWATAKPVFLSSADSIENRLPHVTSGYKTRWSFISELRDDERSLKISELSRKSTQLRGRDFYSTVDVDGKEATFDFIDPRASGLSRHFFARKALSCLQKVKGESDLLRAQALRLAGKNEVAAKLIREHAAPASLPLSHQIMTLDTSIAGYEQSLRIEAARLEGTYEAMSKDADLPFSELRTSLGRVLDTRTSDMKSIILKDVDPVILSRNIQKKLAVDGVSDESTTSNLVSRYVDEVLRHTADVHFAKGEFARSAQIRRRIGGSEAFKIGPKVPPSALATCALEHWKIVEPRSALRYLKDLEEILPNAKRASGLLRDVLSFRALQSGGQTAAGQ